jgi:hypothetical protein
MEAMSRIHNPAMRHVVTTEPTCVLLSKCPPLVQQGINVLHSWACENLFCAYLRKLFVLYLGQEIWEGGYKLI